ncbi:hypothetical protein GVN24_16110 [Rhizobium sp. CRIBSB]|nr:hypothetical protein [Rhizobium sp. CRIBSB]
MFFNLNLLTIGWGSRPIFILLLLALQGCQASDALYLKNGPGVELPAADIEYAASAQNRYFTYLCQQSGLPTPCRLPVYDPVTWTLIVHQGMNDIDRRCDSYLQWLDDKKRSRGPVLAQISDTSTATAAIMAAVEPRSTLPLQIVAQSFNLLSRTIANYHSRLLYEIESSTINSVVIRSRYDFRKAIEQKSFSNRPDAEYALREYMRRCLPFAIETQINDLSTLGSRGIKPNEMNTIYQPPVSGAVVGQALLGSVPSEGAKAYVSPSKPIENKASGLLTSDERAMLPGQPATIQRALCVSPDNGFFGSVTRSAILQAKQGLRQVGTQTDNKNTLNTTQIDFFLKQSSCVNHERFYGNAFEKFAYPTKDDVARFQGLLNACTSRLRSIGAANAPAVPLTGSFDPDTRSAIRWTREELGARKVAISQGSNLASEDLLLKLPVCLEIQGTN